jgi:hypothetical protein
VRATPAARRPTAYPVTAPGTGGAACTVWKFKLSKWVCAGGVDQDEPDRGKENR